MPEGARFSRFLSAGWHGQPRVGGRRRDLSHTTDVQKIGTRCETWGADSGRPSAIRNPGRSTSFAPGCPLAGKERALEPSRFGNLPAIQSVAGVAATASDQLRGSDNEPPVIDEGRSDRIAMVDGHGGWDSKESPEARMASASLRDDKRPRPSPHSAAWACSGTHAGSSFALGAGGLALPDPEIQWDSRSR